MMALGKEQADLLDTLSLHSSLLAQVWRRRGIFVLVFALVVAAVVSVLSVLPKRYQASAAVVVAAPEPLAGGASISASAAWQQELGDPADLESAMLLMMSPRLLRRAIAGPEASAAIDAECDALNSELITQLLTKVVGLHSKCADIAASEDHKLEWVRTRYVVGLLGRSRVIKLAYDSPLPEVAQRMANLLVSAYIDDERTKRLAPRIAGIAWLQQEIAPLGEALQHEEKAIEEFRRGHGLLQGQSAPIASERLSQVTQLLAKAKAAQAAAAAQMRALDGGGANVPAFLESRTIADLKQQAAVIGTQYASQSAVLGPDHPAVVALRRQREEIQVRLAAETEHARNGVANNYAAANAEVTDLSAQMATLEREKGDANEYETQISSMVRDIEVKQRLYVDLSQRLSQLETEHRLLTASVQLVNLAEKPSRPSFPRSAPILAGGLTLGGMLATVAALWRERTDRRLRVPGSLRTFTNVAVLVKVPMVEGRHRMMLSEVLSRLRSPSMLQEAMRALYARLTLAGFGDGERRTLLVTSSDAREGKTFIALGLAQFAAARGKNVLLIECDLRRPSVRAALEMTGGKSQANGLTDYLLHKIDAIPVVQVSGHVGLDVVLAGESSIASTELLAGSRFANLLRLAQSYDLVLLDSPPCGLLMDACVIAPRVDGVIFCARWGQADSTEVAASLRSLQDAGGNLAGLVVTFSPLDRRSPYGTTLTAPRRLAPSGDRS